MITAWIKYCNVPVPCAWVIFLPRAGGIQEAHVIVTDKLPVCFVRDDSFTDTASRKAELPCNLLIMIKTIPTTSVLFDLPHFFTFLLTHPPALRSSAHGPGPSCSRAQSLVPVPGMLQQCWSPALFLVHYLDFLPWPWTWLDPCCCLMHPGVPTGPTAAPSSAPLAEPAGEGIACPRPSHPQLPAHWRWGAALLLLLSDTIQ